MSTNANSVQLCSQNNFFREEIFRKLLTIFVLQDKIINFDWISVIRSSFQQMQGYECYLTLVSLNMNLNHLYSTQSILQEQSRYFALVFIHSQNIIISEIPLYCHSNGEWRKVKVVNQKVPNTFINYMMYVPNPLKRMSVRDRILYCIQMPYIHATMYCEQMRKVLKSIHIPFVSKDFLKGVKLQSVMNLVYLKEVEFPCILFPEELGIRVEYEDIAYITRMNIPVCKYNINNGVYFIELNHFILKERIGKGSSGICNILEVPEDFLGSSKTFVSKEISTAPLGTAEFSSYVSISISPRAQILQEIAVICLLAKLNIPYIVSPFNVLVPEGNDKFSTHSIIIYHCKGGETKFYSTMEFINGTDLRNVDVASLDELTKFSIVLHVTETLNVLHENGFVHNDLHLENMRLESSTNQIFILDFGCCERITENGVKKDVKYLLKLIYHLYSIQPTCYQQHTSAPLFLRPIIKDALENKHFEQRSYKTLNDILRSLSYFNEYIVLDRKWLDFGFFLEQHTDFFQSCEYNNFLTFIKARCESSSNYLDPNFHASSIADFTELLYEQDEISKKYIQRREMRLRFQRKCIKRMLQNSK